MKRLLKLQDHKHTAKRISHEHTSYRGLWVLLIVFGVALAGISNTVSAESYVVSARIAAPIPGTSAQITNPIDSSQIDSANIVISGTCPVITPAIIVTIYNNGSYIGSAGCSAAGVFSGSFSLTYGANVLIPKIVTITNDAGPEGSAITVNYPQPASPPTSTPTRPSTPAQSPSAPTSPVLSVKTDAPFLLIKPNQSLVWTVVISGGESPYTITVDWGDGNKKTYAATTAGEQNLEHIYTTTKNKIIRISVRDATGKEVYTTVAGVTFQQQNSGSVAGVIATGDGTYISLINIWILYALIMALVPLLWLEARHRKLIVVVSRRRKIKRVR